MWSQLSIIEPFPHSSSSYIPAICMMQGPREHIYNKQKGEIPADD
jgi:hypothetical protein